MRLARKNKRKIFYSLCLGLQPKYCKDKQGNIIYDLVDGVKVPRENGKEIRYSRPIEFMGNITFASGEIDSTAYGLSETDYDSKLLMKIGEVPIRKSSLIFVDSKPKYDKNGKLLPQSADYVVKKVAPAINNVVYLLSKVDSDESDNFNIMVVSDGKGNVSILGNLLAYSDGKGNVTINNTHGYFEVN